MYIASFSYRFFNPKGHKTFIYYSKIQMSSSLAILLLVALRFRFAEAGLDVSSRFCVLPNLLEQDHSDQSHVVFRYIEEVDECKDCIVLSRLDDNADLELPVRKELLPNHNLEFGSQGGRELLLQGLNLLVFAFPGFSGQKSSFFNVNREAVHGDEHGVGEPGISVRNKHVQFSDVEISANNSDT